MTTSQQVFEVFNQLTRHEADLRVSAAHKLATEIANGSNELEYSLQRLVRGLSSSRAAARQGFALGLCTLVRSGKANDLSKVLSEIEEDTKLGKKDKGEEEREKLVGRAFGYLALIQSGSLDGPTRLKIVKGCVELSKEKVWIRDVCTKGICMVIEAAEPEEIDEIEASLGSFYTTSDASEASVKIPFDIAVQITLEFKKKDFNKLQKERLSELVKPLASAWRADPIRLHVVWDQLCRFCVDLGLSKELWTDVAEPALLKGGLVSAERKCAGLLVFARLANELAARERFEDIPAYLMSKTVLNAVLAHSKSKTMALNQPSRFALIELVSAMRKCEKDEPKFKACEELLKFGDFDFKSGTSTLHDLMATLSESSAQRLLKHISAQLPRVWAVTALAELSRAHPSNLTLEKQVLLVLFEVGFFELSAKEAQTLKRPKRKAEEEDDDDDDDDDNDEDHDMDDSSSKSQSLARQRFFTLLRRLSKKSDSKKSTSDFTQLLKEIHSKWTTLSGKKQTRVKESTETMESLELCRNTWEWLAEAQVGPVNQRIVNEFESLCLFVGLLLIAPEESNDEGNTEFLRNIDLVSLGEDLSKSSKEIVSMLMTGKKSTKKAKKSRAPDAEEETDPVAVCVQVMLTLLSQPSTLVRDLVTNLSKALATQIASSDPALELLANVLVEDGAQEDEDEDEEVEMDPEEDDDDDDEDAEEDAKPAAAKPTKVEADDDEDEADDESEDEDLLGTENEIKAYDRAVEEFLKQRKASTQKSREKAALNSMKESIAFKLRICDVLESVFSRASDSPKLLAKPVLALLNAAEATLPEKENKKTQEKSEKKASKKNDVLKGPTAALFQRFSSVLLKFFKGKHGETAGGDWEEQMEAIKAVFDRAKNKSVAKLALETLLFYAKLQIKADRSIQDELFVKLFLPMIHAFLVGHSNSILVDSNTFEDTVVNRFPEACWSLLPGIVEIAPRTSFQRAEQIQLASRIVKLRKDSIPDKTLELLRRFTLRLLEKEREDSMANKTKPDRTKSCLKFVQQIAAFGREAKFDSELESQLEALVMSTKSSAVNRAILAVSNRKEALEKLIASNAAIAVEQKNVDEGDKKATTNKKGIKDENQAEDDAKKDKKSKKKEKKRSLFEETAEEDGDKDEAGEELIQIGNGISDNKSKDRKRVKARRAGRRARRRQSTASEAFDSLMDQSMCTCK